MASPADILDERLARGEITPEEHTRLSAHLSDARPATPKLAVDSAQLPKGSLLRGAAGVAAAVMIFFVVDATTKDLVADCTRKGIGTVGFCRENAVKWPLVYISNGLAAFFLLFGIANFALPKK